MKVAVLHRKGWLFVIFRILSIFAVCKKTGFLWFALTAFIILSCSDNEPEAENYLSFEYNGKAVDLKWKSSGPNPNSLEVDFTKSNDSVTYYKEGHFLFGAGEADGYQSLHFINPNYNIQDAPCFIIDISPINSCGHLLSEGLAGHCLLHEGYSDYTTCEMVNESISNPDLYDQNQVFRLVDSNLDVHTYNCHTFESCDIIYGCSTQTNCDVEGTFWAEYLNQYGQSLSITNGKFSLKH